MLYKNSKCRGFTLVEMLIVMSIIIILMALSFVAYQRLQTTVRLNEYTNNFEQNIRKVQRDAMLLEKKPNSRWVYGLGIELKNINKPGTFGEYKTFKWCSPFADYGDDVRTRSIVPNYDSSSDISSTNGNINTEGIQKVDCTIGTQTSVLSEYSLYGDSRVGTSIDTWPPKSTITLSAFPYYADQNKINAANVGYILFEAVTGRAFFYTADGKLVNTDLKGNPLSNAQNLVIRIVPDRGGNGKKITIFNLSGRVIVGAND